MSRSVLVRPGPTRTGATRAASALALAAACGWGAPVLAGPDGGVVTGGQGVIDRAGDVTTIRQDSRRIIIEWDGFNTSAREVVRFEQPDAGSVALNRVTSTDATRFDGALEANGNVWIINPNGVMFGASSRIDVGGLLVSSVDISDDEGFMAGGAVRFDTPGSADALIDLQGEISFAEAGLAGFVAPEIRHRGRIVSRLGRVVMAGKESFSVDISGDGMFEMDLADAAPAAHAKIIADGEIAVEGGLVVLDAAGLRDAVDGTVSVGGVVSAASAEVSGGDIILRGESVAVSGTLDASGAQGGKIGLAGEVIHVAGGAALDASGRDGGGEIAIGKADGAASAARIALVSAGASLRADGGLGAGGKVALWSTGGTALRGDVFAAGRTGGEVSVSSAGRLLVESAPDVSGLIADGAVLFDPAFLNVGLLDTHDGALSDSQILAGEGAGDSWFIDAGTLSLMTGDVLLQATDTLTIAADVNFGGDSLALEAGRHIVLDADLVSAGDLSVFAGASMPGGVDAADGAIQVTGARRLAAAGALTLGVGEAGAVDGAGMAAADVLRIESGANLALPDLALAGGIDVTAGGTLTQAGDIAVAGDARYESQGRMRLNLTSVHGGAVTAISHAGGLYFGNGMSTVAGGLTLDGGASLVAARLGGVMTIDGITAGSLQLTGGTDIIAPGALSVAGPATIQSFAGLIDLSNPANSFGGDLRLVSILGTLDNRGDIVLAAAGDLSVAQVVGEDVSITVGGDLVQTSNLLVSGDAVLDVGGALELTSAGNQFEGSLSLSTGGDVTLVSESGLEIGATSVAGLFVNADGDVTQSGTLTVTGPLTIASTADILLTDDANLLLGPLSLSGDDVVVHAASDLDFASVAARNLVVRTPGTAGQSGALALTGLLTLDTGGAADFSRLDNQLATVTGGAAGGAALGDADGFAVTGWGGDRLTVGGPGARQAGTVSLGGDFAAGSETRADAVGILAEGARFGAGGLVDAAGDVSGPGALRLDGGGALVAGGAADLGGLEGDAGVALTAGAASISGVAVEGLLTLAVAGDAGLDLSGALDATGTVGGALGVSGAGDVALANLTAGALTTAVSGDGTFTDLSVAGAMDLSGAGMQLSRVDAGGDATLVSTGDMSLDTLSVDGLVAVATGALTASGLTAGGDARLAAETGDAVVADLRAGALSVEAGGGVDARRLLVDLGADFAGMSGVVVDALDAGGALRAVSRGDAALTGIAAASLSAVAEGALAAQNVRIAVGGAPGAAAAGGGAKGGTVGALIGGPSASPVLPPEAAAGTAVLTSGGAMVIADLQTAGAPGGGALRASAGAGMTVTDAALGGSFDAATTGGDVALTRVAVDGAATVEAAAELRAEAVSSTGDMSLGAGDDLRIAGATVGGALSGTAGGDILAAEPQGSVIPAAGASAGAARIDVAGDTELAAGGAVRLPGPTGADAHRFGGTLGIDAGGPIAVAAAGDLALADIATPASARIEATGALTQDAGTAVVIGGDLRLSAGEIYLSNGNIVGGAVSAFSGGDFHWSERGSILLADVTAGGNARLQAGADGAVGDAAIRQGGTAVVAALAMTEGAPETGTQAFSGPLDVTGDLDLSSGWAQGAPLAGAFGEVPGSEAEFDRDVVLDDGRNHVGGALSARRIAGSLEVTEEAAAGYTARDETDGGALHIRQVEVLGDIALATSDDVIFDGRMTALGDETIPETGPGLPGREDPVLQGAEAVAEADLRLFLSDGATLTVDATAGGADPSGGLIRFDRAVDGANDLPADRDPATVGDRAGGGSVVLKAGAGDIRVRDYWGAAGPLGDVTIVSARNVSFGHTYAARDPDADSPATRFLYGGGEALSDYLFADDLVIDASGDVVGFAPDALFASFEADDAYFGVNVASFTYGGTTAPEFLSIFGFIGGSGAKAAGLFPSGPRAPVYNLNGCVIGDIVDCTGAAAPRVLTTLRVERAQILNVEREDLFELFVSYGNEELWGVPSGYLDDLDAVDLARREREEEEEEDGADAETEGGE
ncbi:filamentous hemagglutinin N-terminal domain-containing protein [Rhodovulum sp. DZ06]|uniref:two-partner secretion domain-containing protein n=1 Tax=Rhodovulum sp. DZ06 TaxID=3425126 RepID=UPI003D3492D1